MKLVKFKKYMEDTVIFGVISDENVKDVLKLFQDQAKKECGNVETKLCDEEDKYHPLHDEKYKEENPVGELYYVRGFFDEEGYEEDEYSVHVEFIDIELDSYKKEFAEGIPYKERSLVYKRV